MINSTKRLNATEWLIQALSIGGAAKHLEYIHVIDSMAYATNDECLHVARMEIADGIYDWNLQPVADVDVPASFDPKKILAVHMQAESLIKKNKKPSDFKVDDTEIRLVVAKDGGGAFYKPYFISAINGDRKAVIDIINTGNGRHILCGSNNIGMFLVAGVNAQQQIIEEQALIMGESSDHRIHYED